MSLNVGLIVDQFGFLLCILKGIDEDPILSKEKDHSNTIYTKLQKMKKRLFAV